MISSEAYIFAYDVRAGRGTPESLACSLASAAQIREALEWIAENERNANRRDDDDELTLIRLEP